MIGNVLEWTSSQSFLGSRTYVWRGGSFASNRRDARSTYRNGDRPDGRFQNLGFRVAGDVEQA
jgi:formylglycine-generating enzyme required for sulfatase activity